MALRFGANVSMAKTDYGTVLLDERGGDYWELSHSGTLVVTTLLAGGDEGAAADALVAEYDIDRSRAAQDVASLVRELRTAGLAE